MGTVLMVMAVLGGGLAAYGGALLGLALPAWVVGNALCRNGEHLQDTDRFLRKGTAHLALGLVTVGCASYLLHLRGLI